MTTPQRLHSLDNLRASMMWLGIVVHVAAIHLTGESPLVWRDTATSPLADLLLAFIHVFRMPVFFIVAGFFVAMLVQRRGMAGMLRHRFQRIALPFLLLWPPILVLTVTMVLLFVHRMARGSWGLDPGLIPPMDGKPRLNTLHLWFVYLLWWFAVATALASWLAQRLPPAWASAVPRLMRQLGARWWGFVPLTLPLVLAGAGYRNGILAPVGSLLPPPAEWLHNGMFFLFGWALFAGRDALLPLFARRCWMFAAAGLPFFIAALALVAASRRGIVVPHQAMWTSFAYNAATWLWSLAVIGQFLRYLPQRHAVMTYLSNSAYWVYLVHMPLTIGFGALLYGGPLGALTKMLINIGLTTGVCLASYHLLVRGRWLGRLLNGPESTASRPRQHSQEAQA